MDTPFRRIMAANRGEIAVRIIRAGIELGLETVRAGGAGRQRCGGRFCQAVAPRGVLAHALGHSYYVQMRLCAAQNAFALSAPSHHQPPVQLAIYSPADRLQPHRFKADESYQVGGWCGPGPVPVQSCGALSRSTWYLAAWHCSRAEACCW